MKKLILATLILFIGLSLNAQVIINNVDINAEEGVQFCEIIGLQKSFTNKIQIHIDYGQKREIMGKHKKFYLTDKDGKKIKFHSMIEGLNFMCKNGWVFVNSYSASADGEFWNYYHYLLKKKKTD